MTISDFNTPLTLSSISAIAARTSTVTSTAFDLRSYKGGVIIEQLVGVVSGTSPTLNGKIQTSADGSTGWADITGATFTEVTATDSFQKIGFAENQTLGYIRYVGTIAGTTPSFTMGVAILAMKERV